MQRYTNGNVDPQSPVDLSGSIVPGGFYIVCNDADKFATTYGEGCDLDIGTGGAADGNGDDQLALLEGGVVMDFYGNIGQDGSGQWHEFEPTGYKAPLIGRHYAFGVHDCWTLVKDYYESVGIKLRDWDRPVNPDSFRINPYFDKCFKDTGFRELQPDENLQHGDSLLFSINSQGLNHVGVFLLPQQMVLHHIEGRLSSKDFYGEWLVKCTGKRLRYVK